MTNIQSPNQHEPQRGGGAWLSGPMIRTGPTSSSWPEHPTGPETELGIDPRAEDRRPQYNPSVLLDDVAALLNQAGVRTSLDGREHVAAMAAADLLRAMGVKPATAPIQGR